MPTASKPAKPPTKKTGLVKIAEIVRDPNLQVRAGGTVAAQIESIREGIRAGAKIPKVTIYQVAGRGLMLTNGFNRVSAYIAEGKDQIDAEIYRGTFEQAEMAAALGNVGQMAEPLRREDKKRAVCIVLRLHPEWADKKIAGLFRGAVSAMSVGNYRRELEANQEVEKTTARTGTDGKQHAVPPKPSVKDDWKAKPVEDFLKVPRVILQELHNKDVVTAGDLAQALTSGKLGTIREEDKKLLSDQLADLAGGKTFTPDRTPRPSKNGSPTTFDWSEWHSCLGRMINMHNRMRQMVKNPEGADYLGVGRNLGNLAELTKQIEKQSLKESR